MAAAPPALLEASLRASLAYLPDSLVAGEAWLPGAPPTCVAFHTPSALQTALSPPAAGGAPSHQTIDLALVRAHSASHQLAIALAARAAATGAPQLSTELGGDDLLRKLTFGVDTATAVPILGEGGACAAVIVLFSFRGGGGAVRGWAAQLLRRARAFLRARARGAPFRVGPMGAI